MEFPSTKAVSRYAKIVAMSVAAAIGISMPSVKAEPVIGVSVSAPLTPVTLGAAAVVTVLANEAFAEKPFGKNGELAKLLAAPVRIIDGNVKASVHESGELAKVLRATSGISIRDIERYGIFGGPNSIFRKPFG
jgi:hypothetical protein